LAQIGGWSAYIGLAFILNRLMGNALTTALFTSLIIAFFTGIFTSHLYREIILYFKWLELSIYQVVFRVIVMSILLGVLFDFVYTLLSNQILSTEINFDFRYNIQQIFGWVIIFQLWSVIYFAYHYFKNYKLEEIKNLKLEAANTEVALSNLKSQLNPHFIFNAMNSIRALINENPAAAKAAVTQLSNVLRMSLQNEKNNLIPLEEELRLVDDYLAIEKARYEERLQIVKHIDEACLRLPFPPLMLQTLVENAIKHGVSKFAKGSELKLNISKDDKKLYVEIENKGQLVEKGNRGLGIANTKERLKLLYGENASFTLMQSGDNVVARLQIQISPLV
jgi:two-component system LytT family sensor kinase